MFKPAGQLLMVQCVCSSARCRYELSAAATYVQPPFRCNCCHVFLPLTKHTISEYNVLIIEVLWKEGTECNE